MILVDMVDGAAEITMKEGVVSSIEVDFKLSVARLSVSNELDLHSITGYSGGGSGYGGGGY